jgi:hypothetical protein
MKRLALLLALVPVIAHAQDASVTAVPLAAEQLPAVSATQPPPPFTVPGVVAKLDDGLGFSRDAALTQAARQALPVVLGQLHAPIAQDKASQIAGTVGEPMQFVKSYKIVKEVLVPHYTLTVDLVFDQAKLETNFGKTIVQAGPARAETGSPTPVVYRNVNGVVAVVSSDISAAPKTMDATASGLTVHVVADTASAQDKVYTALAKQGLNPVWKLVRRDGGDIGVTFAGDAAALTAKLSAAGLAAQSEGDSVTVTAQ